MNSVDPLARERNELAAARRHGPADARRTRLAFAAAHVVYLDSYAAAPHTEDAPGTPAELLAAIDWERTLAFRRHLDSHGFGIAEAMDTAQRFELGWLGARRLIEETGALGLANGFVAGASYDQLDDVRDEGELVDAVLAQVGAIQAAGGLAVLLPMPWFARRARGPQHYIDLYGRIIEGAQGPLFLHWLGEAFHAGLANYFPGDSLLSILALDRAKVRGVKLSILDPVREVSLRRALLPHDQVVLTGDDWAFRALIEGGAADGANAAVVPVQRWTRIGTWELALGDFSHALLGILDAAAAPMAVALDWLALGDLARWRGLATPCEELGRIVFEHPTPLYKVGLALLAQRNGHQANRMLANHIERARTPEHLARVVRAALAARAMADDAGMLPVRD